jgi:UPF0271 protein
MTVDLNCDMGELADAALEADLMEHITSANVACGAHAGDDATMDRTIRLAVARAIHVGAHPGYPDRENFGRLDLPMSTGEIEQTVFEQIVRLEEIARRIGAEVVHVKPHGALYNAAARDEAVARAIGAGVGRWRPGAAIFGLAGSCALEVWRGMGFDAVAEGFADRRYEPDGSLRSRRLSGALITDPDEAAAQALTLARSGRARTICVHGDTPGAVEVLRACRRALTATA